MLRNDYLHPNGQLPAYEWNFGDVNPPVHAWATMQLYLLDKERRGGNGDIEFLKYAFSKLLVNFTWWVNRKDRTGANVFEGGFLGLDNIGVFDRSSPLPTGGYLDQADGTAWMVFFSQQMLRIAVELALHEPLLRGVRREVLPAHAVHRGRHGPGGRTPRRDVGRGGWLLLRRAAPAGRHARTRLKVRSIVGLLPLAAVAVFEEDILAKLPKFRERARAVQRPPPGAGRQHASAQPARRGQPPHAVDRRRDEAAAHPGAHAGRGRNSSARTAFARCRASTSSTPTCSATTGRSIGWPTCPAIPTPACSAAIPTGAGRCGCRSTSCSTPRCCACTRTTATTSRSSARRAPGQMMTLLRGGAGTRRAAEPDLPAGRVRQAAGRRRGARSSTTIRTGATWCCSTNTFTATPAPALAPAIKPAGPDAWPRSSRPTRCSREKSAAGTRRGEVGLPGDSFGRTAEARPGAGMNDLLQGQESSGAGGARPCRRSRC